MGPAGRRVGSGGSPGAILSKPLARRRLGAPLVRTPRCNLLEPAVRPGWAGASAVLPMGRRRGVPRKSAGADGPRAPWRNHLAYRGSPLARTDRGLPGAITWPTAEIRWRGRTAGSMAQSPDLPRKSAGADGPRAPGRNHLAYRGSPLVRTDRGLHGAITWPTAEIRWRGRRAAISWSRRSAPAGPGLPPYSPWGSAGGYRGSPLVRTDRGLQDAIRRRSRASGSPAPQRLTGAPWLRILGHAGQRCRRGQMRRPSRPVPGFHEG